MVRGTLLSEFQLKSRSRSILIPLLAIITFFSGRHALSADGYPMWRVWFLVLALSATVALVLVLRGMKARSLVAGGVLIFTAITISVRTASMISEDGLTPRNFFIMIGAVMFLLEGGSVLRQRDKDRLD